MGIFDKSLAKFLETGRLAAIGSDVEKDLHQAFARTTAALPKPAGKQPSDRLEKRISDSEIKSARLGFQKILNDIDDAERKLEAGIRASKAKATHIPIIPPAPPRKSNNGDEVILGRGTRLVTFDGSKLATFDDVDLAKSDPKPVSPKQPSKATLAALEKRARERAAMSNPSIPDGKQTQAALERVKKASPIQKGIAEKVTVTGRELLNFIDKINQASKGFKDEMSKPLEKSNPAVLSEHQARLAIMSPVEKSRMAFDLMLNHGQTLARTFRIMAGQVAP